MKYLKIFIYVLAICFCISQCNAQYNIVTGLAVPSITVLPSDVINNNATPDTMQDITGLSFPVVSGSSYYFRFIITYDAAATGTGSRWAINGPTLTQTGYYNTYGSNGATSNMRWNNGYDQGSISSTSAYTTSNISFIEGTITCSANGNVIARFSSEVASSAITAKGSKSIVLYYKLN
jgi:hypothetical protein